MLHMRGGKINFIVQKFNIHMYMYVCCLICILYVSYLPMHIYHSHENFLYRAEQLALEIKDCQAQLGDYNTVCNPTYLSITVLFM